MLASSIGPTAKQFYSFLGICGGIIALIIAAVGVHVHFKQKREWERELRRRESEGDD